MTDADNAQLWLYCTAAGHFPYCDDWKQHRDNLQAKYATIAAQLESLERDIAMGKAMQGAAERDQMSVTGKVWTKRPDSKPTVDYNPKDIHEVHWTFYENPYGDGKDYYNTDDKLIRRKSVNFIEDVRATTAESYKGICRAHVFIDGVPDVWNEWK